MPLKYSAYRARTEILDIILDLKWRREILHELTGDLFRAHFCAFVLKNIEGASAPDFD